MSRKKARLPKYILGIKVPRRARKAVNPWLRQLQADQLAAIAGAAITAGIAAVLEHDRASLGTESSKLWQRLGALAGETDTKGGGIAATMRRALAEAVARHDPSAVPTGH